MTSNSKTHAICLMGPTASGKTTLAVELVQRRPMQIISVDSAQIYRGMDIGTGKPDRKTLAIAPHRLIDIREPSEVYSASEFRRDAIAAIEDVITAGDIPLLVGGTMLYFKALRDGLAELPEADGATRREIGRLAEAEGWGRVHAELEKVDPKSAGRIHPNDPQRLQRALEVYRVSGRTLTEIHAGGNKLGASDLPFTLRFFAMQPSSRGELHERIGQRFQQMLDRGLVAEVERLYRRGDLHPLLPSIKSVSYRQVWQYLDGRLSYDAMVEKSIIATRQLAKRQLTWLRGWENVRSLNDLSANSIDKVLNYPD